MVSEKMGLPYYRRGRLRRGSRGRGRGRPVHNTNFLEKWLFSIICCANFRNQQSFLTCLKYNSKIAIFANHYIFI